MSTTADVAGKARVSSPTVSLVISGGRGISPATASAVRAVIDAIDCRASAAARSRIAAPEGARGARAPRRRAEGSRFLREAAVSGPVETAAPLLVMRGVIKHFGGVQALRGVDFDLQRGEIHALLGENGAGKSTLMNILSGVFAPDAGEMRLEGQPVRFADPRAAQAAGVATIFQELDLVPSLDVTANLFLGRELTRSGVLDRAAMRKEARTRLEVVGVDIDVDQPVGELSVGRRQIVAIAKALTYASQHPHHGRADRGADRGGGRAAVPRDARDRRRAASASSTSRTGSRKCRASPTGSPCCATGRSRASRRPSAPQSELVRLLVGRPLAELYPPRSDEFGKPVLRLEHAALHAEKRAGRLAGAGRTFPSRCARARSSASPASWARGAPSS